MTRCLSRWITAALLWVAFTSVSPAETLAATVERWGLLGSWAVDCSLPPDRDKGALLAYEIRKDGRVMYRRNFGEAKDENEVVSATDNTEGLLNVMVYFPSLHQTREFGLLLQKDDSLRAIYNRSERGEYKSETANTSQTAHRRLRNNAAINHLNIHSEFSRSSSGTWS
ncbi:hypothetical protein [Bradyrhizobium sp. 186]|uniref:hypothetical protein n=1 Tax=Bradyrhizobium sp. 186 TaxID=2782654 RepID=UPI002000FDF9|nr:hypothetical protein [Bradyrhizobium sp. 186]